LSGISAILRELRAPFLTVSVIPVLLAAALAHHETGGWRPVLFLLSLAGAVFLHLGANIINDWFDHLSGNDAANVDYAAPFTGGSRMIQKGLLPPRTVLAMALGFFAAASAVGVIIAFEAGWPVIAFGLAGLFLGIAYTAPGVMLAARGLGEVAIFLAFGLITAGAYYVQTGTVTFHCVVASLPPAMMTTAIILINEFQDSAADAATGKDTLVVRLGRRRAVPVFAAILLGAYLPVLAGVLSGMMPPWTFISTATLPIALRATGTAFRSFDSPGALSAANAATIICHFLTGALLVAGYLIPA